MTPSPPLIDWLSQVIAELAEAKAKPFAMTKPVSRFPAPDSQNGCSQLCDASLHPFLNRQLAAASMCV